MANILDGRYGVSTTPSKSDHSSISPWPSYHAIPPPANPLSHITPPVFQAEQPQSFERRSQSSMYPAPQPAGPSQYSLSSDVEPVPAPRPRVAYEAPVFRTFQERKRAKEIARMQGEIYQVPGLAQVVTPPPKTGQDLEKSSRFLPSINPIFSQELSQVICRSPQLDQQPQPHIHIPPESSRPLPRPLPSSPVVATLERSDTLSSIKSLDRTGFGPSKRPLPKAPVGVNSSRSLDRGTPLKSAGRKLPSIVCEEDESDRSTPPPPAIITPPIVIERDKSPAKFTPLPTLNLPGNDKDSHATNGDIAFSGLPVITVSSEITTQEHRLPSSAIICAKCCQPIIGRIVTAMAQRWHPQCFNCNECGDLLEHVSSYEWEGKAYCHLDYHDKFAYRCFQCKTPIVDSRFVTLNDPTLGERYYHELHFFCSECGEPFLDPSKSSSAGTERTERDEEEETSPFVIQKGHPYCERCHLRLHKPKCKKCTKPIPDIAVNAMGAKWHTECFVCHDCGEGFANNLFFPREGKALCTACWGVDL